MNIKIEEIIFRGAGARYISAKPQTVCEIFYYQPENIEQMPLGNVYIVTELSCVKDCGHLSNLLASIIKREYYMSPAKGIFGSFQAALKKANSHLSDLAGQGNTEWLGKLNFLCGAIAEREFFFAQAGQLKTYLFRQGYLTNLARKIIPEPEKPHPSKIFSSIISGKIEAGDKIVFATSYFDELFSPAGLRQILTNNYNLAAVGEHINKILREQKKPKRLAALLLETEEETKPEITEYQKHKVTTPPIDLKEILK